MLQRISIGLLVGFFGVGMVTNVRGAAELPPSYDVAVRADRAVEPACKQCGRVNRVDDDFCGKCGLCLSAHAELPFAVVQTRGAQICQAALKGRNWDLQELLTKYPMLVDVVDEHGNTPLLYAVMRTGGEKTVEILVRAKANINCRDGVFGATPLIIAAHEGKIRLAEALLNAKALPDLQQREGATALRAATQANHREMVSLLLRAKADPTVGAEDGVTSLIHAAAKRDYGMVQLLLEEGGAERQMNAKLRTGESVILTILRRDQDETMLRLLLRYGVHTINDKNEVGTSPLTYAADNNYLTMVRVLLEARAFVDIKGVGGATALNCAANRGYNEEMRILLDGKVAVDLPDDRGLTPLMVVAIRGNEEAVALLLHAKAQTTCVTKKELATPLMVAIMNHQNAVVRLLVGNDRQDVAEQLRAKDDYGCTPLIHAAVRGDKEAVELLLAARAPVDARSDMQNTALMCAQEKGHDEIVALLAAAEERAGMR